MIIIQKPSHIVALDIGSEQIKTAAAEILGGGGFNLLGLVTHPSAGIKKGSVIDIEMATAVMEQALYKLEKVSGIEISHLVIGFSSTSIHTVRNIASINVSQDRRIKPEDRERALFSAQNVIISPEQTVLQVLENKYSIDGNDGIRDPIGMTGQRLGLDALVITLNTSVRENILQSIGAIGLPFELVYNPILLAESVLTSTEKEIGVILVDMGATITEVSIFQNGGMIRSFVLPVGAENITRDLSVLLKISLSEAKKIKEIGSFLDFPEKDFDYAIKNLQGKDEIISSTYIRDIIISRLEEIAAMIWDEASQYTPFQWLAGGIVLTGGGAKLNGIIQYYGQLFGVPVRFGDNSQIECLYEEYNQPEYTAVLGNLLYQRLNMETSSIRDGRGLYKVVRIVHDWMKDFLG